MFCKGHWYFFKTAWDKLPVAAGVTHERPLHAKGLLTLPFVKVKGLFSSSTLRLTYFFIALYWQVFFFFTCIIWRSGFGRRSYSGDSSVPGVPAHGVDVAAVNAKRALFVTQTAWKMTSSSPLCVTDLKAWTSCRNRQSSPKRSCRFSTGASKM